MRPSVLVSKNLTAKRAAFGARPSTKYRVSISTPCKGRPRSMLSSAARTDSTAFGSSAVLSSSSGSSIASTTLSSMEAGRSAQNTTVVSPMRTRCPASAHSCRNAEPALKAAASETEALYACDLPYDSNDCKLKDTRDAPADWAPGSPVTWGKSRARGAFSPVTAHWPTTSPLAWPSQYDAHAATTAGRSCSKLLSPSKRNTAKPPASTNSERTVSSRSESRSSRSKKRRTA